MIRRRAKEERRSAQAVAGLVPGFPLCVNDGFASGREGVVATAAGVRGSKSAATVVTSFMRRIIWRETTADQCRVMSICMGRW